MGLGMAIDPCAFSTTITALPLMIISDVTMHHCIYRKRAVQGKNLAVQKIWVEYLKFQGGDLLPLLLRIRYTICIDPDHHPTTDLNTSESGEVDTW